MKRKYFLVALAVLGGLVVTITAFSHSEAPHRLVHRFGPDMVKKHMEQRLEELNLTGDQKEQVEAMKMSIKDDVTRGMFEKSRALDEIAARLKSDNPDVAGLAGDIKKTVQEKGPQKVSRILGYGVAFYNILDEAQQAVVIEQFREKLDRAESRIGRFSKWRAHRGESGHRRFRHAEKIVKELDLTPAQEAKLKQAASTIRYNMVERIELKKDFIAEIDAELSGTNPDVEKVAFMIQNRVKGRLQGEFPGLDSMVDFYETLDDEQKAKVNSHILERIEKAQKRIALTLEKIETM